MVQQLGTIVPMHRAMSVCLPIVSVSVRLRMAVFAVRVGDMAMGGLLGWAVVAMTVGELWQHNQRSQQHGQRAEDSQLLQPPKCRSSIHEGTLRKG